MPKTHRQERLDTAAYEPQVGGLGGETNTGSNVGSDGVGVYDSKSSADLRFRHVAPGSTKITTTLNGSDIDVDVDVSVVETTVDHDNIVNAADGSHVHIGTSAPSEVAGLWGSTRRVARVRTYSKFIPAHRGSNSSRGDYGISQ